MKRKKGSRKTPSKDTLLVDESICIHRKKGNGVLRRQVWVDAKGIVTRYSLAYINYHLYQQDNGRVLGYDNAHSYHHRHYMGDIEPIEFSSFEEIENCFQQEYEKLHAKIKK